MANKETDISSPIVTIAHTGILLGASYLVGYYTNTIPGAVIGTIAGSFFGPLGAVIGTVAGMVLNCL